MQVDCQPGTPRNEACEVETEEGFQTHKTTEKHKGNVPCNCQIQNGIREQRAQTGEDPWICCDPALPHAEGCVKTWTAENSKNSVSRLHAHCILDPVIAREGVLTVWYGRY
jgi:hypothetical protein